LKKFTTYDVRRTPSDGKSSPGLWPGELKSETLTPVYDTMATKKD